MLRFLHAVAHAAFPLTALLMIAGFAANRPWLAVVGVGVGFTGAVALIARDCLLSSIPLGSAADVSRRRPRFWPHPAERAYGPYISVRWGVGFWLVFCAAAYVYARAGWDLAGLVCCMLVPQAFILLVVLPWFAGRSTRVSDLPAVKGPEDGPPSGA